jgi:streptomycin 6-kinase
MISKELRRNIEGAHGEAGRAWLTTLPALLKEFSERWTLTLEDPFQNLSYNLVIPGVDNKDNQVVLKLGPPGPELTSEIAALALFKGRGAVRLLAHDAERGALLLERILPGNPLHQLQDEASATQTAASLMRRLWREPPAQHSFPTLSRWFRSLQILSAETTPIPGALIDRAKATFADLQAAAANPMIIHGDLHHENILYSDGTGWLAIDPKGVCGDPGYEVGTFMLNQLPGDASPLNLRGILTRRISIFAEALNIAAERLRGWAFCHAMLSAAWSLEERADYERTIFVASVLQELGQA